MDSSARNRTSPAASFVFFAFGFPFRNVAKTALIPLLPNRKTNADLIGNYSGFPIFFSPIYRLFYDEHITSIFLSLLSIASPMMNTASHFLCSSFHVFFFLQDEFTPSLVYTMPLGLTQRSFFSPSSVISPFACRYPLNLHFRFFFSGKGGTYS